MILPYGSDNCSGGTPVQLPAFVGVGQELDVTLSFSPATSGTFSDYLDLSGLIFNLYGTTPSGSPDIVPFRPSGWSDSVIVTNTPGSHVDGPSLASSPLYVSWAVENDGSSATTATFYPALYLDGAFLQYWRADPPFPSGHFGFVADYPFGPLSPGSHTLRLAPDSTNTLGPSHDYTKTFTINQTTAKLRLVATDMNLGAAVASRTQKVDLGGASPTLAFSIGEGFTLKALQVNSDGTDGPEVSSTGTLVIQTAAPAPVTTTLDKAPAILFPGKVVLSFSQESKSFVPVHSGTAVIALSTSSGNSIINIQITSSGVKLGSTHNNDYEGHGLDSPLLSYADLRGIPPQIVKAVIQGESTFSEAAYRYEPLSIDFRFVSTKYCETLAKPCSVDDVRILSQYGPYAVQTFADSLDPALKQGSGLMAAELALRERYSVTLDTDGNPLKVILHPPPRTSKKRKISLADGPISMENILYTNNATSAVPGGWYTPGSSSGYEVDFRTSRLSNKRLPFTAQTVLAASYGLMQVLYNTAIDEYYVTNGIGRQPSGLFDENTNLDLGTDVLALKYKGLGLSDQFDHVSDLRDAWRRALVRYNGGGSYGPAILMLTGTYFPIH
jgi:hypothetical protein